MKKGQRPLSGKERGQVLPVVLALLGFASLTLTPALAHTTSTLSLTGISTSAMEAAYAADAGIERSLLSLVQGTTPLTSLPQPINGANVTMETVNKGTYAFVRGELIEPSLHSNYLSVSGSITHVQGSQYQYTLTVTRQPAAGGTTIHLTEVGVRLPSTLSYQPGSSQSFTGNLSTSNPSITQGILRWQFQTPYPSVSTSRPIASQTFYVTGDGTAGGDYTWVVANRSDVGAVGELTGTFYQITATAAKNAEVAARAEAVAVLAEGAVRIVSWKVLKE